MPFDLDAYLARIGYSGDVKPTAPFLAALHEAHAAAILFENVDVLLGRTLGLSIDAVMDKMVTRHRGGYCYEHAILLHAALATAGFQPTLLAARVRMGYTGPRPRTHALIMVEADGRNWLVDVGFGLLGLLEPLALEDGATANLPLASFRLRREGPEWLMQGQLQSEGWQDLYLFSEQPQEPVDYVMANHFTQTWPHSPFIRSLIVAQVTRARRSVLIDRRLTVTTLTGTETRMIADADDLYRTLSGTFALDMCDEEALAQRVFVSTSG